MSLSRTPAKRLALARRPSAALAAFAAMLVLPALALVPDMAMAQARPVPDTFTATTTGMTPAGVTLRIDVLEWSDDAARAAVISALTSDEAETPTDDGAETATDDAAETPTDDDAETADLLAELPTVGYLWADGSAVGYALKYAHRASSGDGDGERVTFVTDKPLGAYGFKPWAASAQLSAKDQPSSNALGYSVIELRLDGEDGGAGTISLAADVIFDQEAQTVSLAQGDPATNVLTGARREPKPYWAQGG